MSHSSKIARRRLILGAAHGSHVDLESLGREMHRNNPLAVVLHRRGRTVVNERQRLVTIHRRLSRRRGRIGRLGRCLGGVSRGAGERMERRMLLVTACLFGTECE